MCLGSLQSLDWNGGLEWWNGMAESHIQQKIGPYTDTSLLTAKFVESKLDIVMIKD